MSTLTSAPNVEQVCPADKHIHDQLEASIRRLRHTVHSPREPRTLGDDMQRCRLGIVCSGFIPALEVKLPALMEEGVALLARFNGLIDAGEILGPKALLPVTS